MRRYAFWAAAVVLALVIPNGFSAHAAVNQKTKPVVKAKTGAVCPTHPPGAIAVKPAAKKVQPKGKSAAKPDALPWLLDLGATKCIPCKMMVPVLDELSREYKGKLKVEFIDVWQNREATRKYKVQTIPTQIFYDAKGKEIFRHVGFFPKADILKTFKGHGIKLTR
jgi:thiol-disulfide isomerase/thioredoxin